MAPQTFQAQSQNVSPALSVMAVSPLANVVSSPSQSVAAPHPASLAAVFKEMMDAAEMNQTVPTIDEIKAEYKHRQATLIGPASPFLIHTPSTSPVISDAMVKVAQAELQLAKTKMAALEAKAEQSELEMSSIKTLMQSMEVNIQGMQNIISSNMATAITTDSRESPRPSNTLSPASVRSSISRESSSSEWSGPSWSSCMMKRDKHNKSRHYS